MKKIWCHLDEIADIHLGFKSLQNEFFYLTSKEVEEYGIEKKYLKEIFLLSDFNPKKFLQEPKQSLWLFYCQETENDLRGTNALKYIQAMAKRPATMKKQGSGKQFTISKVLEAQGGDLWYAPKASLHKAHIWIRKAFGGIFAPFLFEKPVAVDQRCNRIVPKKGDDWKELAAITTTSLFALSLEGDGASSMGAGALEWKTKSLRDAKVIDLRKFSKRDRTKLVKLAESAWSDATPVDFSQDSVPHKSIIALDDYVLKLIGSPITSTELYEDLSTTTKSRVQKPKTRRLITKTQETTDVAEVAMTIAESVRPIIQSRRFPEDFSPTATNNQRVDVPVSQEITLHAEPFMNVARVIIQDESGRQLIDSQFSKHVAELIVRALLFGRRNFSAPLDESVAIEKLKVFLPWVEGINLEIEREVASSALGTRYEEQLKEAVLSKLGINSQAYASEVWGTHQLSS